jgi:hypothetical protein
MHKGGACGGTGAFFYFAHKKKEQADACPSHIP